MCGLFGFVGAADPNPEDVLAVMREAGRRGPHAYGYAWIDAAADTAQTGMPLNGAEAASRGPHVVTARGSITQHLSAVSGALRGKRLFIGQCRLVTSGPARDARNNQPLVAGSIALAHNGNVYNADAILETHGLRARTRNDSEALAQLIAPEIVPLSSPTVTIADRVRAALHLMYPCSPTALLVLSAEGIVAARWPARADMPGHPLYLWHRPEGLFFCSRPLPDATLLADGLVNTYHAPGRGEG